MATGAAGADGGVGADMVKENVPARLPLGAAWLAVAAAGAALALAAAALVDLALPAPAPPAPLQFSADLAYQHLLNFTAIGPRVAGSDENEVLGAGAALAGVRAAAAGLSAHNTLAAHKHTASGAFPLAFFDGMNNVYRDVQSVVARLSPAHWPEDTAPVPIASRRHALLLNCHYDTVPDSPGASDDGAGCAVLLEVVRALGASPRPLRRPVLLLLNGAEENIMQASHAFVTTHRWAGSARAFVNVEACGAGGREVLFQAGPRDPWLVETYAAHVPHPFASSLAQELFESGLIPADTDFRVFRDFGNLSGLDLAWSANGYVYHTRLDTADRVPRAALQRTGDNVLALAAALLDHEAMDEDTDEDSRQPVFFDVLGAWVVCVRPPAAAAAALLALLLVPLRLHLAARDAAQQLRVSGAWWWGRVWRGAGAAAGAGCAGVCAAAGAGLVLHVAGARLVYYSRPWLVGPLFAAPALGVSALVALWATPSVAPARGWWRARLAGDALATMWAGALLTCAALRLRSGFVPLLWVVWPTLAEGAAGLLGAGGAVRAGAGAAGAVLPVLQTWYLALGSLNMFVPITGRSGAGPVPVDVLLGVLVAALVLAACSWLLPVLLVTRNPKTLVWAVVACGAACLAVSACGLLGEPYSAARPHRLMVFHTRRTLHQPGPAAPQLQHLYWVPELDPNTPRTVDKYAGDVGEWWVTREEECAQWVYCGAPYFLPVRGLVPRGLWARAPGPPDVHVSVGAGRTRLNNTAHHLHINITGPQHVVLVVSPGAGSQVAGYHVEGVTRGDLVPQRAAPWGTRHTYFFTLHDARARHPHKPARWTIRLLVTHGAGDGGVSAVSVSGHAMSGPGRVSAAHARLLAALPAHVAATGWGVDMHILTV